MIKVEDLMPSPYSRSELCEELYGMRCPSQKTCHKISAFFVLSNEVFTSEGSPRYSIA